MLCQKQSYDRSIPAYLCSITFLLENKKIRNCNENTNVEIAEKSIIICYAVARASIVRKLLCSALSYSIRSISRTNCMPKSDPIMRKTVP